MKNEKNPVRGSPIIIITVDAIRRLFGILRVSGVWDITKFLFGMQVLFNERAGAGIRNGK